MNIMLLGTGSAAGGIAELVTDAFCQHGLTREQARQKIWFVDRSGLVTVHSRNIKQRIVPFAKDFTPCGFVEAIKHVKPDVLIGATGVAGTFDEPVVRQMAAVNLQPVIIALSNPTSHTECSAQQAYLWSEGRVIFASGSPFSPVQYNGRLFRPGQGNNAYIFPGMGLGVYASSSRLVTQSMFLAAAKRLSEIVNEQELEAGTIYPTLTRAREASLAIAMEVFRVAVQEGLSNADLPNDLAGYIRSLMYDPQY